MSSSFLDALVKLCEAYYEKVNQLEGEKYDMEKEVELKDYRVCNIVTTKTPYVPMREHFKGRIYFCLIYIYSTDLYDIKVHSSPPACL